MSDLLSSPSSPTTLDSHSPSLASPASLQHSFRSASELEPSSPAIAGLQPEDVYRSQMSPWRFKLRKWLIVSLDHELPTLESIQLACRSPPLDWLMVHSSWLGSHSFFILTLPLLFWFGDSHLARSQVYVLASAVYVTGALKDFFCVPRPYSPPIFRLSISNHASEYGFPSTHSATSTSTILIALECVLARESISLPTRLAVFATLGLYAILLVFGRVYCGMHSVQDVICGSSIGFLVWAVHRSLSSSLTSWLEGFTAAPGLLSSLPIPLIVVIFGLAVTAAHPQPIDDCPCFEDSTAFVAVSVGVMIGHWASGSHPFAFRPFWGTFIPTHNIDLLNVLSQLSRSVAKIILGLLVLFLWRFALKEALSRLLPPLFRLAAPLLQLPRRHYFPTSDYVAYRDELRQMRREAGLQATIIPSVLHLPIPGPFVRQRQRQLSKDAQADLHPALQNRLPGALKKDPLLQNHPKGPLEKLVNSKTFLDQPDSPEWSKSTQWKPSKAVKHHDVDVLMRLIVYGGIGFLAAFGIPNLFIFIGLDT